MGARNRIWDFWKSSSALTWLSAHQLSGEKVLLYFVKQKRFLERQLSLLTMRWFVHPTSNFPKAHHLVTSCFSSPIVLLIQAFSFFSTQNSIFAFSFGQLMRIHLNRFLRLGRQAESSCAVPSFKLLILWLDHMGCSFLSLKKKIIILYTPGDIFHYNSLQPHWRFVILLLLQNK